MVRWSRDRDGWRGLERLALREADETRRDPRQILGQLGLVAEPERPGDRRHHEGREEAEEVSRRGETVSNHRRGRVARDVFWATA